jgi:dTMP kinase
VPKGLPNPAVPVKNDIRAVLAIPAFRKLWWNLSLSSLGDWLGLLATTALAKQFAGNSYSKANIAIAGVFIMRLLPSVLVGPFAGVIADRFDRRRLMYVGDTVRGLLTISIPLVHTYWWLYTAIVLIEIVGLFWGPAKDATVPNLVPRERLEAAYQASLIGTYGSAPVAALLFSLMAIISNALATPLPFFKGNPVDLALYIDGLTGFYSAVTIYRLKGIPKSKGHGGEKSPHLMRSLLDGWKFIGNTPIIRGLIVGMVGAFVAGGTIIGLGRTFVSDLGGGNAAYGLLFGAVFFGMALGMWLGPKTLKGFSRRRLFGLALIFAGGSLALLALIPNLVLALVMIVILGASAGVAWVSGFTMLGLEVKDEVRGRTFAFVQSVVRVTLISVLAIAPILAAGIGRHTLRFGKSAVQYSGAEVTLLLGGIFAAIVGIISYRQMDDRKRVSQ